MEYYINPKFSPSVLADWSVLPQITELPDIERIAPAPAIVKQTKLEENKIK